MVGVVVGVEHAVDPIDAGAQNLLAQIGAGIDQHRRALAAVEALHHHRAAAAAVLRVGRIAVAPEAADARHPARRTAAEDGEAHRRHATPPRRCARRA